MRDDVKTEALVMRCEMEPRKTGASLREVVTLGENCNNGDEVLLWFLRRGRWKRWCR